AYTLPTSDGSSGQVLTTNGSGSVNWQSVPGDNWGSQVVQHNGTLTGDGTSGNPLGVSDLPSGDNDYIQNQIAGAQASADFWIDGEGRVDILRTMGNAIYGSTTGDGNLFIYTNGGLFVDLDNDSDGSEALFVRNGTNDTVFQVTEGGNVTASGNANFDGNLTLSGSSARNIYGPTAAAIKMLSETSMSLYIDSDDATPSADANTFRIYRDAPGAPETEVFEVTEAGNTTILGNLTISGQRLDLNDGDAPNVGSNLVHWNNLNGVPADFADGVDDVNDADADPNNELITAASYTHATHTLTITEAGTDWNVDLSELDDTTFWQDDASGNYIEPVNQDDDVQIKDDGQDDITFAVYASGQSGGGTYDKAIYATYRDDGTGGGTDFAALTCALTPNDDYTFWAGNRSQINSDRPAGGDVRAGDFRLFYSGSGDGTYDADDGGIYVAIGAGGNVLSGNPNGVYIDYCQGDGHGIEVNHMNYIAGSVGDGNGIMVNYEDNGNGHGIEIDYESGGSGDGIRVDYTSGTGYAGYFNGDVAITGGLYDGASFGAANQVLTADGAGNFSWQDPAGGGVNSVTAGLDLDNSGTATDPILDIEPTLDYVSTIQRASSDITIQTTSAGSSYDIIMNADRDFVLTTERDVEIYAPGDIVIENTDVGDIYIGSTFDTDDIYIEADDEIDIDADDTLTLTGWGGVLIDGGNEWIKLQTSNTTDYIILNSGILGASGAVLPGGNNEDDLGNDANRWRNLHIAGNIYVDGSSPANQYLGTDASGNLAWLSGGVGGSGTLNRVPKWTPDGNTLGNSIIYDDGTNVGIGTTSPAEKLHVALDAGTTPATGSDICAVFSKSSATTSNA
ncbi:hypothetical protein DRQ33_08650, partial [bacterium]